MSTTIIALFCYVVWRATEQNLLRRLGYKYEVSRQAVNFFVTHANRLVDLCPRRLELIAEAFAAHQPAAALEAQLNSMLAKDDIRPKLRMERSWVTVPGGILLWPDQPFSKLRAVAENDPPRRIRKHERLYQDNRLLGEQYTLLSAARHFANCVMRRWTGEWRHAE